MEKPLADHLIVLWSSTGRRVKSGARGSDGTIINIQLEGTEVSRLCDA